jgi:ADP-ribose pyrophosphatase YjhB (NUDIX family)
MAFHYVVSGVIRKGDKVLLIKRGSKEAFHGFWAGVGGHIEKDETIREAIIREIKEELGVNFTITRELGFFEFIGKTPEGEDSHYIHLGFEGKINGEIKPSKREILEYGWFTHGEAKKLKLMPNYKHFLKISFEGS